MTESATPFSPRSLLQPIALVLLALVAVIQFQQSKNLQRSLEALSTKVEHLSASDDFTAEKLDVLRRAVSDRSSLNVEDVLKTTNATKEAN